MAHALIIDPFTDAFVESVSAIVETTYRPELRRASALEALTQTRADILVQNSSLAIDAAVIEAAPQLKLVVRAGVGLDHIDVTACEARGILVRATPGANAAAVAEHTVGMLLALRHNLVRADAEVRAFQWQREANRGFEIGGKTIGLIGFGHTGSEVARCLRGFDCRVIAYDKYKKGFDGKFGVKEVGLPTLQAEAAVISLHIPLTPETDGWIDRDFFARCRSPFWLLNLARGPILNLGDAGLALERGKLAGLALDVLPNEKFQRLTDVEKALYRKLFARPDVVLAPHIGGWTFESRDAIEAAIFGHIQMYLAQS